MKTVKSQFKFKGGVHPDYNKELARNQPIEKLATPAELVISMSQHLGAPAKCLVKVGDFVKRGQLIGEKNGFISVCVRASADGKVKAIEKRLGPAGGMADAVILDTTAKEEALAEGTETPTPSAPKGPILPPLDWKTATKEELLKRVEEAGICGMGGAGFPTNVKLSPPPGKRCEYLILNGAECEPYLTADYRVMLERAPRIRLGVEIMRKILGMPAVRIAIEANKPEAIKAMEEAFADIEGNVEIVVLPVLYPQGSEKHQIYATVKRIVPEPPALPIDVGCVVENVGTVAAISDAVELGEPLLERVTTVSGDAVATPKNILAPCGTKYSDLVAFCGGEKIPPAKIISGGTMMGFAVSTLDIGTTKTTSGLLLLSPSRVFQYSSQACINCGRCLRACPMNLNPAEISKAMEADDVKTAEDAHVMTCIECGACSFGCPAYRTITQFCRRAKASIRARMAAERAAAQAAAEKEKQKAEGAKAN
ncbi:MAG: electron transport complex subunit RsxC [Kiritimatiellae bacterium]|nr:electron transport complex subunit RsxC [Kiritimatiellia bacterium]